MVPDDLSPSAIRQEVERVVQSPLFANSERMVRFLRYVVDRTLAGRAHELKEYAVGVEVFDRRPDYDTRIDPIVRVEARRLREKLSSFYSSTDYTQLRIELPKGSYVPRFTAPTSQPLPPPPPRSIAVLPFATTSDYLSDGLTQELIHRLTKVKGLRVVAWNSSARMREADAYEAGRRLGVSVLLTGSLRTSGSRVRVLAQLVDVATGVYLWSETFDRTLHNVLEIEDSISEAIVQALAVQLGASPVVRRDPRAYDLYLKGRYHWNWRTSEGFQRAIQEFKEAIEIDQNFALAWVGLADTYAISADYGCAPVSEAIPLAKAAALRALEIDPTLGEAEATLGIICSTHDWQWEEGGDHFRRAIELNPSHATTFHWYGVDHLALLGRFAEASAAIETAVRLDPLSAVIQESRGYIHLLKREYPQALAEYRRALDFDPNFHKILGAIGRASMLMGDVETAIGALEQARALLGDVPSVLGALAQAHGEAGNHDLARELIGQLGKLAPTRQVNSVNVAIAHLGLREYDEALSLLERGYELHESSLATLGVHPLWDPLRTNPRFQRIVASIFGDDHLASKGMSK